MKLIIEVNQGCVVGVYTNDQNSDFNVCICDRDDVKYGGPKEKYCAELSRQIKGMRPVWPY
jgi:hypothetical protein